MSSAPLTIDSNYWPDYQFSTEDLDFIKNTLFELETPQNIETILRLTIEKRVSLEKKAVASSHTNAGRLYLPQDTHTRGEALIFSRHNWERGTVKSIRPANNPGMAPFQVIEVEFQSGSNRSFASGLAEHDLNNAQDTLPGMEYLDASRVLNEFSTPLLENLAAAMHRDEDLVTVAALWFHRSLLIDIHVGHLNLAEAILDMAGGGPLTTANLIDQLDLKGTGNPVLLEFSLNQALHADPRFDEVGPAGEVLWFLEKLEPEDVRKKPVYLQYPIEEVDGSGFSAQMLREIAQLDDECFTNADAKEEKEVSLVLTYPHWRAGTLPLNCRTDHLFPTAFESPRIKFEFVDSDTKENIHGWVVRPHHYVAGLRKWYLDNGVIPGSVLTIQQADADGKVSISANKRRPAKEWVRTALVGADGGVVLASLKQQINTQYEEKMTTAIPDTDALDRAWTQAGKTRQATDQAILHIARELTKLNPQGILDAIELFASVNVIRRIPLAVIFKHLVQNPQFAHVGDLYFRLIEESDQE
jgi:hypothetical protein